MLHKTLMHDLGAAGGHYRSDRRMIAGAKHQPPRPELVTILMPQLFFELKKKEIIQAGSPEAVRWAAWAHWAIARIHPFEDGNGRMARLWQDLILLRAQLAPAIIRLQDRDQNGYYDALAAADDGDLNPLVQLIAQRTAATLNEYISAQQQVHVLTDWAAKIAGEASIRAAERRRARYLRWSTRMEAVKNDFQRCVARITASGIEVQMSPYPLIDETTWENICYGVGAKHTWFFTLTFRKDLQLYSYIFFFDKHYWSDEETEEDRSEPRVTLLISEQVNRGTRTALYQQTDNPIELREMFATDNSLIAVRKTLAGEVQYVRDADPMKLAMEFIEQVLLRRVS